MKRRMVFAGLVFIICVLVLMFADAPALSQSQPPSPKQGGTEAGTLRVSTRVVQVNVIVHDKNGRPVTGLTKKDFTILDQGQPQTIASLSEQTNRITTTLAATSTAAVTPSTFSNRYQEVYGVQPSVSVILIDSLSMLNNGGGNVSKSNMTYARAQIVKFLNQLQPQDRVALYFLSDKIYILHDFTADPAALLRALTTIPHLQPDQGNASPPMDFVPTIGDPTVDGMMDYAAAAIGRDAQFNLINRVGQTTAAMEAIANHLVNYPGRKNLIWISGGFPWQTGYGSIGGFHEKRLFDKQIEPAARALSNANVTMYPVDARGLMVDRAPDMFHTGAGNTADAWTTDTMVVFADRTGGRVFNNTNDLTGSIHRAIEDSRLTYVLSYYPNHNQWDGGFREIKVKVNRPGVEVRARHGYFAFPDAAVSPKSKIEIMVDAAKNPIESAALGLDVRADAANAPGARQITTQVRIDATELLLAKTGDRWTDSIDVKWVQLAADGRVAASASQTLNLSIRQANYEKVLRDGITFSGSVNLVTGATDVRLVARDSGNGSVGTVNISVAKLFGSSAAQ
jgi:VWFA-related protein